MTNEQPRDANDPKVAPSSCRCCAYEEGASATTAPPAYIHESAKSESYSGGKVDPAISTIETTITEMSDDLRKFSLKMQEYKEIAMKEYKTHDLLADFMEGQGFKVTRHAYGLDTAVEAVFEHKEGGKCIGYNSEMDALPGIGHACGHNLIAIAGIAAAVSTAKALKNADIAGKVVLLGTPAEEAIGGKIILIKAGAYKQMDVCLMAHPAPFGGLGPMLAITEVEVEYRGHTAHAAGAPWEGKNALDAAVLAYTSIAALRQQIHPSQRVHTIFRGEDRWVVNVIPDFAGVECGIRAPLKADMLKLRDRVYKCFEAAAEATGCTVTTKEIMHYADMQRNSLLGREYKAYMEERALVDVPTDIPALGSTDFGDVSYVLPSIHPLYAIPTKPGAGNHTVGFAQAAATIEAHEETLKVAKGLAAAGWRVAVDDEFAKAVKSEFEATVPRSETAGGNAQC